jgi:hypothetical protein
MSQNISIHFLAQKGEFLFMFEYLESAYVTEA